MKRIHRPSISVSLVAVYCGKKSVMTKLKITLWDDVGLYYFNSRIAVLMFTLLQAISHLYVSFKTISEYKLPRKFYKLKRVFKWLAVALAFGSAVI